VPPSFAKTKQRQFPILAYGDGTGILWQEIKNCQLANKNWELLFDDFRLQYWQKTQHCFSTFTIFLYKMKGI